MADVGGVRGKFPGIGDNLAAAAAAQSSTDVKKQVKKMEEPKAKGLGLEDIPDVPMPQGNNSSEETVDVDSLPEIQDSEAANGENILEQIEQNLLIIQSRLKDYTMKKLKYAADPRFKDKSKELLKSAAVDLKYINKIAEETRDLLA